MEHSHEPVGGRDAQAVQVVPPEGFGWIQALDPVSGAPARLGYSVEIEDRTVYFSSQESRDIFTRDPEKYMGAVNIQTDWIQKTDPVTGQTALMHHWADYMGRRFFFSEEDSIEIFLANPDEYVRKVNSELVPAQALDPVSGDPISNTYSADFLGRRIYFSSMESLREFTNDHLVYIAILDRHLEERGEQLTRPDGTDLDDGAIVQQTCPVMGGTISPQIYADHEGRRIYFCCAGCINIFKGDADRYTRAVDEEVARLQDAAKPQ